MKKANTLTILCILAIFLVGCQTPQIETKQAEQITPSIHDEVTNSDEANSETSDEKIIETKEGTATDDINKPADKAQQQTTDNTQKSQPQELTFKGKKLATNLYEFSKEDFELAQSSGKKIFLFFFANWCPKCRTEISHTQEAFNELNNPEIVGFRIHYKDDDTGSDAEDMARTYNVIRQHTKIYLDSTGTEVFRNFENWQKERYFEVLS